MRIYRLGLKLLHLLPPEAAHKASLLALRLGLGPRSSYDPAELRLEVPFACGSMPVRNMVGLAAGYDKDADAPLTLLKLGFGLVECGTVTPLPQGGNPKPRLFRLTEDQAVINRMGFNNHGLEAFMRRLERDRVTHAPDAVVGLNIGANKDSSDRIADYVTGLKRLWGMGHYFTINISSPNTPGLRALQGRSHLDELLGRLNEARQALKAMSQKDYPLLVKIAPDLDDHEIEQSVESALAHYLDGMIISNTTLSREGLKSPQAQETGGMSGAPLMAKSTHALRIAALAAQKRLILVGAGGVASGYDAYQKVRNGASLVQLYSALVYHGPMLVDEIKRDLVARLKADGFTHINQAIGVDL